MAGGGSQKPADVKAEIRSLERGSSMTQANSPVNKGARGKGGGGGFRKKKR